MRTISWRSSPTPRAREHLKPIASVFSLNWRNFLSLLLLPAKGRSATKPDPEPFRRCLAKLAVAPPEAVYVGDDYRIDICGAQAVGMHAVWIQHHSVNRTWPEVETKVPIITGLDQLVDIENMVSVL